jgi:hypothetical protein
MKKETRDLLSVLNENNEDFEYYPTTDAMLTKVKQYSIEHRSILDIGCGSAKLRNYFPNSDYFVIEKSKILINRLPSDVYVLGTDFNACTLIDKKVDMIFCNPPYSEFKEWTIRIIKEGNFKEAFLIIPQRWQDDEDIKQALTDNIVRYEIIDTTDFLDAERQARAKVNIIKFTKSKYYDTSVDPFKNWFEETFNFKEKKDRTYDFTYSQEKEIKNQLVGAENKIDYLVNLYDDEMNRLFNSFKAICSLDEKTLHDIGVETKKVIESLKFKIQNTKVLYWRLVFDYLDEITKRLTAESRRTLFHRFERLQEVDFNKDNIQAVVIWVLKNASSLFDDQLVKLYKEFTSPDNIVKYKSNQRVFKRNEYWNSRFDDKSSVSHYCLTYRMVVDCLHFRDSCSWTGEKVDTRKTQTIVDDLSAIANNLGFEVVSKDIASEFGEKYYIYGKDKPLIEFKLYKNGNTHIKLDIEFCKAMNVEVARLLGWIQDFSEVAKEFPDDMKDAGKYYGANFRFSIEKPNVKLLEKN